MRRKDRERPEAFALQILQNCEYATLATLNPDGTPYCIPLSPVLEGKSLYFHCAAEGRKLDNIRTNNQVCVSAVGRTMLQPEKYTTEYESAVAAGTASEVTDTAEKMHALRLICEKYAPTRMEDFEKAAHSSLPRTAIIRIDIETATGKENAAPKE